MQIEDKGRIVLTEKGKALAEGTYEKTLCDFPSADGYWGKQKKLHCRMLAGWSIS